MKTLQQIKRTLDQVLLVTALTLLSIMIIIIIYQVFSRQLFSTTPSWSEEVSRFLFIWVSFLGIAYGFKEKLHIALGLIVGKLPSKVQDFFDYLAKILVILLGVIMLYFGTSFTILMSNNLMPGTGLSSSWQYVIIPITGFYITLYGINLLFIKGMHQDYNDAEEV